MIRWFGSVRRILKIPTIVSVSRKHKLRGFSDQKNRRQKKRLKEKKDKESGIPVVQTHMDEYQNLCFCERKRVMKKRHIHSENMKTKGCICLILCIIFKSFLWHSHSS